MKLEAMYTPEHDDCKSIRLRTDDRRSIVQQHMTDIDEP